MPKIKIPKNPKEITNHWLAEALRESGRLKDAKIVNHAVQTFEIGIGSANIVRISVEYDPPVEGAPSSMIAIVIPSPWLIFQAASTWAWAEMV